MSAPASPRGEGEPGSSAAVDPQAAAAAALARLPASPPVKTPEERLAEAKFQEARKAMIKVVNWQVGACRTLSWRHTYVAPLHARPCRVAAQ